MWLMEFPQVSIYFKLGSEMLSRTSSQICGRWYLPMFLLRDGLFALMYRASFMVHKRFWSSLPSMVKLSMVTSWPEMLRWSYMGMGPLDVPCTSLQNFLLTLQYTHHHNPPCHTYICMWPHFFEEWIFVFWGHKKVFDGMTSFKMYINPIFLANVFIAFTESLMVRDNNVKLGSSDVITISHT